MSKDEKDIVIPRTPSQAPAEKRINGGESQVSESLPPKLYSVDRDSARQTDQDGKK